FIRFAVAPSAFSPDASAMGFHSRPRFCQQSHKIGIKHAGTYHRIFKTNGHVEERFRKQVSLTKIARNFVQKRMKNRAAIWPLPQDFEASLETGHDLARSYRLRGVELLEMRIRQMADQRFENALRCHAHFVRGD